MTKKNLCWAHLTLLPPAGFTGTLKHAIRNGGKLTHWQPKTGCIYRSYTGVQSSRRVTEQATVRRAPTDRTLYLDTSKVSPVWIPASPNIA